MIQASERGRTRYARFLHNNGIDMVDCFIPITSEMQVRGEGHPNGKINAMWADCIAERVQELDWVAGSG